MRSAVQTKARMNITDLDTGASYETHYEGSWKDALIRWYNKTLANGIAFSAVEVVDHEPEVGKVRVRLTRPNAPDVTMSETEELSVAFEGSMPPMPDKTNL